MPDLPVDAFVAALAEHDQAVDLAGADAEAELDAQREQATADRAMIAPDDGPPDTLPDRDLGPDPEWWTARADDQPVAGTPGDPAAGAEPGGAGADQ